MSKEIWKHSFTVDVGIFIVESENKDGGYWWSEEGNFKRYFDITFKNQKVTNDLNVYWFIVYFGKFATVFYRFRNK